ncbi:hypothetical protein DFJ77DRAFT_460838 [Powellomyces hirtus]|nr:hypothetical protein DFJ77DRAFT_460838 [Powellomyces hirtus]
MASTRSPRRRTSSSLEGFRRLMETPNHTSLGGHAEDEHALFAERPLTAEKITDNPPPGWGRSRRGSRWSSQGGGRLMGVDDRSSAAGSRRTSRAGSLSRGSVTSRGTGNVRFPSRGARLQTGVVPEETAAETAAAAGGIAKKRSKKPYTTAPVTSPTKSRGRTRVKAGTTTHPPAADVGKGWNSSRTEKAKTPLTFFTSIMNESPQDMTALKKKVVKRKKPKASTTTKVAPAAAAAEKTQPPSGKITAVDYERTKQLIALLSGTTYEFVGLSEVSRAHIAAAGGKEHLHKDGGDGKKGPRNKSQQRGGGGGGGAADLKSKRPERVGHERRTSIRGTTIKSAGSGSSESGGAKSTLEEKRAAVKALKKASAAAAVREEEVSMARASSSEAESLQQHQLPAAPGAGPAPSALGGTVDVAPASATATAPTTMKEKKQYKKKVGSTSAATSNTLPPIEKDDPAAADPPPRFSAVEEVSESESENELASAAAAQMLRMAASASTSSDLVNDPLSLLTAAGASRRISPPQSQRSSVTTPGDHISIPAILLPPTSPPGANNGVGSTAPLPEFAMPQQTWGLRPPRKTKPASKTAPSTDNPTTPQTPSTPTQQQQQTAQVMHAAAVAAVAAASSGSSGHRLPPRPNPLLAQKYLYRTYLDSIMHPNILLPPFHMPPLKQVLYGPYEKQLWEYFYGRVGWEAAMEELEAWGLEHLLTATAPMASM